MCDFRDRADAVVRRWHAYEIDRGGRAIIDYDCAPSDKDVAPASSRLAVLAELGALLAEAERGKDRIVAGTLRAHVVYLRALLGQRSPLDEYIAATQGCDAVGWSPEYVTAVGERAVLDALLQRVPSATPGVVPGWRAVVLLERIYPALVPGDATTSGSTIIDLSRSEWQLIDAFEDSVCDLARVNVDGAMNWAYVISEPDSVNKQIEHASVWNIDVFARRHLATYVDRCRAWRIESSKHSRKAGTSSPTPHLKTYADRCWAWPAERIAMSSV